MPETLPEVRRFSRQEFIEERFHYEAGEHVTILGPTGSGKTYLAYQLMDEVTTQNLQGVILVMKPRDSTVKEWSERLEYRTVKTWPPPPNPFEYEKPRGYVLWPRFSFDPDIDDTNQYLEFRRCILDSYRKGDRVLFGDEAYSLAAELNLERELRTLWTKGRSMGCGLWAASQKPTHIPLWAYSQAHHLFLANDPDLRARKRFDEIGGVDPQLVARTVSRLGEHEWLYIRRKGPVMAIVEK
jgi:energy-coupling factor transporter ATP-binding protein EcfA2